MEIDQKFNYHFVSKEKVANSLVSDPDCGISHAEAKKRKEKYGANKLPEKGRKTAWKIFIKQFKDFLILILAIAAVISWVIGEMADVYIIAGVILFNAIMGFVQEYRAVKAIQSIKNWSSIKRMSFDRVKRKRWCLKVQKWYGDREGHL